MFRFGRLGSSETTITIIIETNMCIKYYASSFSNTSRNHQRIHTGWPKVRDHMTWGRQQQRNPIERKALKYTLFSRRVAFVAMWGIERTDYRQFTAVQFSVSQKPKV